MNVQAGESRDSFEDHYRRLIAGSIERSAKTEWQVQRALGHPLRARRAEERVRELALLGIPAGVEPWPARTALGRGLIRFAWLALLGGLLASVAALGVHSLATGAVDVALIVLTFAWFRVETRPSSRTG